MADIVLDENVYFVPGDRVYCRPQPKEGFSGGEGIILSRAGTIIVDPLSASAKSESLYEVALDERNGEDDTDGVWFFGESDIVAVCH